MVGIPCSLTLSNMGTLMSNQTAGDIFPATIMIKGSFVEGFTYHILNHPFIPSTLGWCRYDIAHTHALETPRTFT